ncbi:hypothetical protein CAPTEDRAFT_223516 [Capitella teleta]|uniref:Mab-21-like nucleotidyltransferase domain-containing protein n=1 Tax=Capitella teleta TaxID=283909 RepID=R7UKS8_CAPTE|nr:hypothetical protein CAPTEDRAFT_223516 [Capitella teleta]|eukprot:ELU04393.1 hypothetical protein CAPTEDRAFT_223516 [Capitella teleta]
MAGYRLEHRYNMGSRSLTNQMEVFYRKHVAVNQREMDRMASIYDSLKSPIRDFLQQHLPFDIGDLIERGNTFDGPKITKPHEINVLVPLEIPESYWRFEDCPSDRCFVKISERWRDPAVHSNLKMDGFLSASRVRALFLGVVQRLADKYMVGTFILKPCSVGPGMTLEVHRGITKLISVHLMPLVKLGDTWLIAKPHPKAVDNPYDPESLLWRRFYAHQESPYIKNLPKDSLKILMIIGAIRKEYYAPMGMLPWHVYKVAFLHWHHKEERRSDSLSRKAISFLHCLSRVVSTGVLHPYPDSDRNANLLKCFNAVSLDNVSSFVGAMARSESRFSAAMSRQSGIRRSFTDFISEISFWYFVIQIAALLFYLITSSAIDFGPRSSYLSLLTSFGIAFILVFIPPAAHVYNYVKS